MALHLGDTAPDFTPVCTTELGRAAALLPEFEARDTLVIALSVDSVEDHRAQRSTSPSSPTPTGWSRASMT